MRNRAKCRLCGDIIESYHPSDSVGCKCGQIGVDGGPAMGTWAIDYANFLRVDDLGNEIVVQYQESKGKISDEKPPDNPPAEFGAKDLINELDALVKHVYQLPEHFKSPSIDRYDLLSFKLIIEAIFKKGDIEQWDGP